MAQFKMIQSKQAKPEEKEKVEHLKLEYPDLVDNMAYLTDLKKEYQAMVEPKFSDDQKNILITMLLKIQEVEGVVSDLSSKLDEISLSNHETDFKRVLEL